jgi:glutathione S-transferase
VIELYSHPDSGHAHRVHLMLRLLDLPFRTVQVDLEQKAQKSEAYLQLNPWGEVPLLVDGEVVVRDSTAILVYLARQYDPTGTWLPHDAVLAAGVQEWLSVASGELLRGPALARSHLRFKGAYDLVAAQETARKLFGLMDSHLARSTWLAGPGPTIADVANYSYIAVSDEGGLSLEAHEHIRRWLKAIEDLPRFVPMHRLDPSR